MAPLEAEANDDASNPEDTPVVKALKVLDDQYLALEKDYDKEVQVLQKRYAERQKPMLDRRTEVLTRADGGASTSTGTPALKSFWLTALKNHPAFEDDIEEHDEPVLEYVRDVTKELLDESDISKGFKITFHFVENPYFTNETLVKELITEEGSPYTGELEVLESKASEINWKPGKDVTIETVSKKVKGGGAKKAKQKQKETVEPRPSLFRSFFRSLKKDEEFPEDLVDMEEDESDLDPEEMVEAFLEQQYDMGVALRDQIIPFAVRWYTGEAAPEDDDDEDEEEESEDDDDDDEDEDEEERPQVKGKKPITKGKGGKSKESAAPGAQQGQSKEECKQQ